MFNEGIRKIRSDDRGGSMLKEIVDSRVSGKPG